MPRTLLRGSLWKCCTKDPPSHPACLAWAEERRPRHGNTRPVAGDRLVGAAARFHADTRAWLRTISGLSFIFLLDRVGTHQSQESHTRFAQGV